VFEDARHPYTKALIAAVPVADPRRRRIHETASAKPLASPIFPIGHAAERSTYDEVTPGHFVLR
jgi:glutathione transport system ATP-binding protein